MAGVVESLEVTPSIALIARLDQLISKRAGLLAFCRRAGTLLGMSRTWDVGRWAVGLWLALGFLFGAAALAERIEVEGHRGARSRLPENTLPAMEYALELGVDVLEMDLAVTKDRVLVLSHDPHINPVICLDPAGKKIEGEQGSLIFSLTLSEVKKYDCGSLKNPRFPDQKPMPGTKIPTLDEVLDLVANSKRPWARKVRFNIETKIQPEHPDWTTTPEEFASLLVSALKKRKLLDRAVIQSFDYRTLEAARKIEPQVRIAALSENSKEDLVATVRRLKAEILSPYKELVTPELVKTLRSMKVEVVPWTANTPAEWEKLVAAGVPRIITDDPEPLIEFLKKKGRR